MIIDGKKIAEEIFEELEKKIQKNSFIKPCLAVVLVGDNPASSIYVKKKIEACEKVGIKSLFYKLDATISEKELLNRIDDLNRNKQVNGILVQLPLPSHIDPQKVTLSISPEKDVDGFHPINLGKILTGETNGFVPCTPLGIKVLFEKINVNLSGKHVVIVGRSNIVGKPLAALLMQNAPFANATVSIVHSKSENIKQLCLLADVIVVAIGKPLWLKKEYVKKDAIVIDVGINRLETSPGKYKIVGDVDFKEVLPLCKAITPVPGGIGPITIAMLLQNTYMGYIRQHQ